MKKFKAVDELLNFSSVASGSKIEIRVGMSTCGIAAGGKKIFNLFEQEIEHKALKDIQLKRVGCLGLCYCEPNVEVIVDGMPSVLYGKVGVDIAKRIIEQHVIRGVVLDSNIYDKPYVDVLKEN